MSSGARGLGSSGVRELGTSGVRELGTSGVRGLGSSGDRAPEATSLRASGTSGITANTTYGATRSNPATHFGAVSTSQTSVTVVHPTAASQIRDPDRRSESPANEKGRDQPARERRHLQIGTPPEQPIRHDGEIAIVRRHRFELGQLEIWRLADAERGPKDVNRVAEVRGGGPFEPPDIDGCGKEQRCRHAGDAADDGPPGSIAPPECEQ